MDRALSRLEVANPRHGKVVELRFFAGLSFGDVAKVLDVSGSTVDRAKTVAAMPV